eukprot:362070-Chlamydomonas_euryale.AAC.16
MTSGLPRSACRSRSCIPLGPDAATIATRALGGTMCPHEKCAMDDDEPGKSCVVRPSTGESVPLASTTARARASTPAKRDAALSST